MLPCVSASIDLGLCAFRALAECGRRWTAALLHLAYATSCASHLLPRCALAELRASGGGAHHRREVRVAHIQRQGELRVCEALVMSGPLATRIALMPVCLSREHAMAIGLLLQHWQPCLRNHATSLRVPCSLAKRVASYRACSSALNSQDKEMSDPCRVGGAVNPLLQGLTTTIGREKVRRKRDRSTRSLHTPRLSGVCLPPAPAHAMYGHCMRCLMLIRATSPARPRTG